MQNSGSEIGSALKKIAIRLKEVVIDDTYERDLTKNDCFNCKNFIRKEVYNQQYGMHQYWSYCNIDIKNKNYNNDCKIFEVGEPIVIEKQDEI